jgi:hypothetical protein
MLVIVRGKRSMTVSADMGQDHAMDSGCDAALAGHRAVAASRGMSGRSTAGREECR